MLDLIIHGGTLIDGSGAPARRADVGVERDRIAAIGDLSAAEARQRVAAHDRVVAPGFIDLHTHCGFDTKHSPGGANMNYLRQGVTTVVGGNCGFGPVDFEAMHRSLAGAKDGPNLAMMIGHNSVRQHVLRDDDRVPTEDERRAMKRLVAAAMDAGAIGFSSGLYYVPGCYARTEEVTELARTAAAYGGFYSTHMRTESDEVIVALDEAIEIGRGSGLPVEISHHKVAGVTNWGRSEATLARIEEARRQGIDISPDQYPYTASCARAGTLLPRWVCAGGDNAAQARLADPETRKTIQSAVIERFGHVYGGDLSRIRIASSAVRPDLVGQTFAEIAAARGATDVLADMAEFAMELVRERPASCDTMCVFHTMNEADVVRIMRYASTIIASDGWGVAFGAGHPHPRLYGTFPRVLGRYCREQRLFSLEEAIRKMTSRPAARLGLRHRGMLSAGAFADVTVFDPGTVNDRATFDEPHRYPDGIDVVIVNGTLVLDHGTHTGALPGVFIPRPA